MFGDCATLRFVADDFQALGIDKHAVIDLVVTVRHVMQAERRLDRCVHPHGVETVVHALFGQGQSEHWSLGDVLSQHEARGISVDGFKEVYSRHSKTLFGVGNSEGSDRRVGLETEIVALTNPYTDDLSAGFQVQVYYRNDLRPNTQVEVFEKAANSTVTISLYRTNDEGIAVFPVRPGYRYMVDAVVLRAPSTALMETSGAVWETLWANLTFAVPE